MVTSNELDKIRPSYRTTLIITSKQFPLPLTVPCRGAFDWYLSFNSLGNKLVFSVVYSLCLLFVLYSVFPSYPKHVILKPEIREDQLLPGFICKELMLEVSQSCICWLMYILSLYDSFVLVHSFMGASYDLKATLYGRVVFGN